MPRNRKRDYFWEEVHTRLTANGWVITDGMARGGTFLIGLTPTGKAFQLTISTDGTLEIDVAGRSRTARLSGTVLDDDGPAIITEVLSAYGRLPSNER